MSATDWTIEDFMRYQPQGFATADREFMENALAFLRDSRNDMVERVAVYEVARECSEALGGAL